MKARAPGKILLTGAYAVLEGAPAIVMAVDRYAVADTSRDADASIEVREALGRARGPAVDVSLLFDGGAKLGLGSSAAALVATLGVLALERGDDLASRAVRDRIFDEASSAHARAQGGGSGVDVAASVYGGVLRYVRGARRDVRAVNLPAGVAVSVFWSGQSARTSDLRGRVDALRARDARAWSARMTALAVASERAADACDAASAERFVAGARTFAGELAALGDAADAPIVLPPFAELGALAEHDGATFFPSGAGGGDVGVHIGGALPTERFIAAAGRLGIKPLGVQADGAGVHPVEVT